MTRRRSDISIAVGLFTVSLLVRWVLLARHPFDGLYGQDAFAYYDYALTLRANLLQNQPIPAFFWPIGFPLYITAVMSVIGVSPLAAQLASMIAGAGVAPLTYVLAREVLIDHDHAHTQLSAIVAGTIVGVSGQLMISSLSIMADATALMWATAAAWLTLRYARTLKPSTCVLAVLGLSLAVVTRWTMALLAAPWTLAVIMAWRPHWQSMGVRRAASLIAATAIIGGALVGGQLLSGSHAGDLQVVSWNPLNAVQRDVINSDGVFHYDLPIGLYYALPLAHPAHVFPLFLPFLLIGVWSLRKLRLPARVVLIGWPLMVYVFLIGIAWQNPRFMLPMLPPLAVWVAVGIDRGWEINRRWRAMSWRTISAILIGAGLIGSLAWSGRVVDNFIDRKDADLAVVRQLERSVPPDATVMAFGLTAMVRHYTALRVIELFDLDEAALSREVQSDALLYLLIDPDNVEQQWPGKSPSINYHWLQTHRRLKPIATLMPYQVFEIVEPTS